MSGNARIGDIWVGICCCHSDPTCIPMAGVIVTSSLNVTINNRGAARLGDTVIGYCGHPGTIVTASASVNSNNRGSSRIGDSVVGCTIGTIAIGSQDVISS